MALSSIQIGALVGVVGIAFTAGGWAWSVGDRIDELERWVEEPPAAGGGIPSGVIMAFDLTDGCPEGWKRFEKGTARVLVGAGNFESDVEQRFALDERNRPLEPYAFHQHGGEQQHVLTVAEMPSHEHALADGGHAHTLQGLGHSYGGDNGGQTDLDSHEANDTRESGAKIGTTDGSQTQIVTTKTASAAITSSAEGGSRAHNTMPPYIALYFCKKY